MTVAKRLLPWLAGAALGCGQLSATWTEPDAALGSEPFGTGTPSVSAMGDGGSDGGSETLPHPEGCGDRLGPSNGVHDTVANCPLPAQQDVMSDAADVLPAPAYGVPLLVLGDDALLVDNGSRQATLYDLHARRERAVLMLADTFATPMAVADSERICLIVGSSGLQLHCFDRKLGTSLWNLLLRQQGSAHDLLIEGETLWVHFSAGVSSELVAVDLASGTVLWRRAALEAGRILRVGPDIAGYDQELCMELASPEPCLRAVDATTGESRAAVGAQYSRFVWRSADKALFTNGTEFIEYDAGTGNFDNVTAGMAAFTEALGTAELFAQGEPLADGQVLVVAHVPGSPSELVLVQPSTLTFRKLGVPAPKLMRVHGDVLVADGALVPLTDAPTPDANPSIWFGIFGFDAANAAYVRKIR